MRQSTMRLSCLLTLVSAVLLTSDAIGQVPTDVLFRVIRVRSTSGLCSGFTIDVGQVQYLVTARHCIAAGSGRAQFEWWNNERWNPLSATAILPRSADVDIVAFALPKPITVRSDLEPTLIGIAAGQQVYFAGYPYGLATTGGRLLNVPAGFGELPFLKSGVLSATDARNNDAVIVYVDGHNNPGFSGGPIVFQHLQSRRFRVAGVISAYRGEALPVVKSKDLSNTSAAAYDDLHVRGNTGIVVGYSIHHIVEAIGAQTPQEP
jgi:S1-C subfamily serine protease